jgi:hypothetical protein
MEELDLCCWSRLKKQVSQDERCHGQGDCRGTQNYSPDVSLVQFAPPRFTWRTIVWPDASNVDA